MILNINQLRAFYYASNLKSITLAANELMVTPPAVTVQIKNLERSLEIKLLYREGNSIQLTEVGNTIFKKCHSIFIQIKDMENLLGDLSTTKSGVLRIGCPQMAAEYLISNLIARFKQTYPGIRLMLDQGSSSEMINNIINHKNELAVIRYNPNNKRLKVKEFGKEKLILIAAPNSRNVLNNKISVTQLSTIPLILRQKGSATRAVVFEYLHKFKVNPVIVLESESIDLIKKLVFQDNGASFLPKSAIQEDLKAGSLKAIGILEGSPILEYGIGYLKRNSLSPAAWSFLRLLNKLDN